MIRALWGDYANRGFKFVDLHVGVGKDAKRWLPYAMNVPRNLLETFIAAAKAKGLPPGERYLLIPARSLVTEGIRTFYGNLFLLLSLGAGNQILGSVGLMQVSAMVDETDPSTLKEDEVIILVKMADKTLSKGDGPTLYFSDQIDYLISHYPKKFFLLDLSGKGDASNRSASAMAASIGREKKRIKKIIVASHGEPGKVVTTDSEYKDVRSVLSVGQSLAAFRSSFSTNPEVYFDGCLVAGNQESRADLDRFAFNLLPEGGSVSANRVEAVEGYSGRGSYTGLHGKDVFAINKVQKALIPVSPVLAEGSAWAAKGLAFLIARVDSQMNSVKFKTDPLIMFGPASYRYVVGSTSPASAAK